MKAFTQIRGEYRPDPEPTDCIRNCWRNRIGYFMPYPDDFPKRRRKAFGSLASVHCSLEGSVLV